MPVDGKPFSTTLPVDTAQVGWVMMPITGAAGVGGCALITTLADDTEVHPAAFTTVKVYVPAAKPDIVVLVPDPFVITPPGLRVSVHVPLEGNPFNSTLPVATQVGWVMVPATGAAGVTGCAFITTSADEADIQPDELVTV